MTRREKLTGQGQLVPLPLQSFLPGPFGLWAVLQPLCPLHAFLPLQQLADEQVPAPHAPLHDARPAQLAFEGGASSESSHDVPMALQLF